MRNFLLLLALCALALADLPILHTDPKHMTGKYGPYPTQEYHTTNLIGPHPNLVKSHPNCSRDDLYIFWTPRGWAVPKKGKGPMILDRNGSLVWMVTGFGDTYNMNVQKYKGEKVLTFWAGDDTVGGHGQGFYYMYNQHYRRIKQIGALGGLKGDLHEFKITDDDHAIITVYERINMDLSGVGGEVNGRVWNGLFQEIDIATNKLVFQWNASQWFNPSHSYRPFHPKNEGYSGRPWDFFHINSVQKDRHGNYLVSGRYSHAATYVNGKTGEPIWFLGGKRNSFKDLSNGKATKFFAQHDCRMHDDGKTVTIFDNAANWEKHFSNQSRAIRVGIDTDSMTATLLAEYKEPFGFTATSQGSAQIVDGLKEGDEGIAMVGYGFVAAFSEFDKYTGEELCSLHFQPKHAMGHGGVQSYRMEKYRWVGKPKTRPATVFNLEAKKIWVSWFGATEVKYWSLQDLSRGPREVLRVPKIGFETVINATCPETGFAYGAMRVAALDKNGKLLSVSLAMGSGAVELHPHFDADGNYRYDEPNTAASMALGAFLMLVVNACAFGGYYCYKVGNIWVRQHTYGRISEVSQYELAYNDSDSLERHSHESKDMAYFERDEEEEVSGGTKKDMSSSGSS